MNKVLNSNVTRWVLVGILAIMVVVTGAQALAGNATVTVTVTDSAQVVACKTGVPVPNRTFASLGYGQGPFQAEELGDRLKVRRLNSKEVACVNVNAATILDTSNTSAPSQTTTAILGQYTRFSMSDVTQMIPANNPLTIRLRHALESGNVFLSIATFLIFNLGTLFTWYAVKTEAELEGRKNIPLYLNIIAVICILYPLVLYMVTQYIPRQGWTILGNSDPATPGGIYFPQGVYAQIVWVVAICLLAVFVGLIVRETKKVEYPMGAAQENQRVESDEMLEALQENSYVYPEDPQALDPEAGETPKMTSPALQRSVPAKYIVTVREKGYRWDTSATKTAVLMILSSLLTFGVFGPFGFDILFDPKNLTTGIAKIALAVGVVITIFAFAELFFELKGKSKGAFLFLSGVSPILALFAPLLGLASAIAASFQLGGANAPLQEGIAKGESASTLFVGIYLAAVLYFGEVMLFPLNLMLSGNPAIPPLWPALATFLMQMIGK